MSDFAIFGPRATVDFGPNQEMTPANHLNKAKLVSYLICTVQTLEIPLLNPPIGSLLSTECDVFNDDYVRIGL